MVCELHSMHSGTVSALLPRQGRITAVQTLLTLAPCGLLLACEADAMQLMHSIPVSPAVVLCWLCYEQAKKRAK